MKIIRLPGGKTTSQVGLGCGVLTGGLSLRSSRRMVETALDLGITHFDVAPSYGMGLAENALGDVIGNDPSITIATKVGIARPLYSYWKDGVRLLLRGTMRKMPGVKQALLSSRALVSQSYSTVSSREFVFNEKVLQASLEESLKRLKRDRIEWLFAHEPSRAAMEQQAREGFDQLVTQSLITSYGVGTIDRGFEDLRFGAVLQTSWQNHQACPAPDGMFSSHFGVIRGAIDASNQSHGVGYMRKLLQNALASRPNDMFLISAGTPARLRELLAGIQD